MAQNTTIAVPAKTWTRLTNAAATAITFQNNGGNPLLIKGTAGAVAPTTTAGALVYQPGEGELNSSLADMFPGVASVDNVYAYCQTASVVFVSHA